MGPSGCGKTTLLNVLAHRDAASGAKVEGSTFVNGTSPSTSDFRRMTSFVEQEDALIGCLVRIFLPSTTLPARSVSQECL
jgi:ABC-type multidrug transport system ATPase subunit